MTKEDRIRALRAAGRPWKEIGRIVGMSPDTCMQAIDPEYRARRNAKARENAQRRRDARSSPVRLHVAGHNKPPNDDLAARLAEIPRDTRTLTGIICGDPVYERSALAMKMKESR